MPQGLAPVTTDAGRARRRRPRPTARPLAVALVALAALVSPWEAGLLPGPASGAVGESTALAQAADARPSTADGTADDCPVAPFPYEPHKEDQSLCVLELPACPRSPFDPTRLMRLSMPPAGVLARFEDTPYKNATTYDVVEGYDRYPEFCEERVESSSPDYAACTVLSGYAVKDDGVVCRIFYPIRCVAGLHQAGAHTCRAVQRRSWTCDAGYHRGNQFGVCFLPAQYTGGAPVPACAAGAPDFGVFNAADRACETYVGQDVLRSGGERGCSEYSTGPIPDSRWSQPPGFELEAHADNSYWCGFDAAGLDPGCHDPARSPRCSHQASLCLKRASRTGGCDQIIKTVRCRGLQDAFRRNRIEADGVRRAGCAPCATLPFEPPTCEGDDTALPSDREAGRYLIQRAVLRCSIDFSSGRGHAPTLTADVLHRNYCPPASTRPETLCSDPPSGLVEWSSDHASGLAMVNSAVILRIADLSIDFERATYMFYNHNPSQLSTHTLSIQTREIPRYRDSGQLDGSPRQFPNIDPDRSYGNLFEMATNECRPFNPPLFNMVIEELRPGSPDAYQAIVELFGGESLEWWDSLTDAERQRRTGARGDPVRSVIECHERTHSCVWRPQRPGYYRIVGAGGWWMASTGGSREWGLTSSRVPSDSRFSSYGDALNQFLGTPEGRDRLTRMLDSLTVKGHLDRMESSGDAMFDYTGILDAVGMQDGSPPRLRDPNPHDENIGGFDDWLYSEHARGLTSCPFPIDLRVICSGLGVRGNYTETAPVGIIVHEVRTQTVAAVQNR